MELISGKELQNGKYRIIDVLGQGGFGITYLAQQVSLGRKVAIKEFFMKEHCNRDETSSFVSVPSMGSRDLVEHFKQKFLKEARTIASFTSSSIVNVFDVFEENGTAYYVMEYLEGDSLKAIVDREGAIPEETAVKYIRQIGSALSEIHSKKLVHLDIKPANIMLNFKGEAVLIDFGISKHYDETGSQTSSGLVGLSEGYAPMEQYKKGGLTSFSPATDIYSLGATLFKLLTGQTPPHASDVNDDGLPPMPETLSATVRKAVESAMQPRRKDRPQSVKEFIELVERGEMKDATSIFGNASSDGSSAASQNVMPLGSQKASVAKDESGEMKDERAKSKDESGESKDERAKSKDATSLSMGTGQNAANGNAAVEENEIEVEVVEVPSAAQKPASEPKQPKEKKSSKGLWIVILLLLVIGGAVGGFMFLGGSSDVKKDSVKDSSVQQQQIVPAESVVEQTAELVITGAPNGANVYVDGKYFDKTPFKDATISIGEHAIKVVKEGYETYEKTHTFNSQSAAIDVNLKKSTALLNLSTNPSGASVYVDGSYIGTSYISGYNIEQGNHTIKVVKDGYDIYEKRYSFDGNSSPITVNLKKSTALLYLSTNPSGASVYVDGSYIGTSYISGYKVEQGDHTIKVVKDGYDIYEKRYSFDGNSSPITVNLKKSTALLYLSTNPTGASVYVDGSYIGTSYISGYKVEQGSHKIKITKQGYKDIVETHNFSSGSKNLSFNLSEKDITPSEAYSKGVAAYNKKDYPEAVKWYRKAAEQGHARAQCDLGFCYDRGYGVSQSWSEAVKWYRKAAEQGQVNAQHNLGWCYYNGKGVSQSYYEAVKWYRKAAEQGHADAQCNLGLCYENGYGVSQSWSEAVKWYRKAAEQGNASAQCNLGWCYEFGKGVSQSYYEAVKWYSKAADQGNASAQCNFGWCYYNGKGVSQSYYEAVKWYRKAAEQGLARAQYNLGGCYEDGKGVSKSISDAVKWYRKAAEQGYQSAKDALKRLGY